MNRTFRVHRGQSGLRNIRERWDELLASARSRRYFHTVDWYTAYLDCLEERPEDVFFIEVYQGAELEAIVPLKRREARHFGLRARVLEIPHNKHLLLQDFVVRGQSHHAGLVTDLMRFLRSSKEHRCDMLNLGWLLEDSSVLNVLRGDKVRMSIVSPRGFCDYLEVQPYDRYLEQLSGNFRRNLKKARNRLAKRKQVEFVSARSGEELMSSFERFLEVEASGWKGHSGTGSAIKLHDQLVKFYRKLLVSFARSGDSEVNLLTVDGKVIAAQFALASADTLYILKIGYDEANADLSPGNMLLEHVLKRENVSGGRRYVNLVTDVTWHHSWRPSRYQVYDCRCYNATPMGVVAFAAQNLLRHGGR